MAAIIFNLVTLCLTLALASSETVPAPNFRNPYEKYTNKTIDQLIVAAMGGRPLSANPSMGFNNRVLAELDMVLTKEQFLSMYQPPQIDEMMAMGMIPAPLGTTYDAKRKNFYGPLEKNSKLAASPLPERQKRKATRDTSRRWTDRTMPYRFADGHFNKWQDYMIGRAMTDWERYTCIRFRPSTDSDRNLVQFQNGQGCNSMLGMVGGVQMLNLENPGCRYKGLYLHEIGHALGLVHEHQLPDRDQYIRILYDNVSPSMRVWFNKYTTDKVNQMGVQYQLSSVMHYGITAFSKDGQAQTIEALDKSREDEIGRVYLKELAYSDVEIVNKMYTCADHCPDKTKCGPNGHLDQNCNCICKDGSSDCDRTNDNKDESCANIYNSWACYIWANQGECERNPNYMKKYCIKSCRLCGDQNADSTCKDVYKEGTCKTWKKRGDCVTNPGWMKIHCKATCNLCDGNSRPEVNCEDIYSDKAKCMEWAEQGECKVNPVWMFNNCKKSCQSCDKDGVDEDDKDEIIKCVNKDKRCDDWARSGECVNNAHWMIFNCRKACEKCDDGTCKNLFDDTKCEEWKRDDECVTSKDAMELHCAKTCKFGVCADGSGKTSKTTKGPNRRTTPGPVTSPAACENLYESDEDCRIWAEIDHCNTNPGWMIPNCAKACNACGQVTTKPPVVTTEAACENLYESDEDCKIWAENDHCNTNPGWMIPNCAKACNACGQVYTPQTTATITTKPPVVTTEGNGDPDCIDAEKECSSWAKHGHCDSSPGYNLIYCKKSCNNCNGCRDTEEGCSAWAEAGFCQKRARFMLRSCQKSCRACEL